MTLTSEDVRNKQFSTVKMRTGYDMDEVDAFLDEVESELTRLAREHEDLQAKAARAAQAPAAAPAAAPAPAPAPAPVPVPPPAPAAAPTDSAVRMLELAQRTADEHVASAKAEAERLLADAREKHRSTLASMESERSGLQTKIDDLRNFEREYRSRLKSYLEGQLRDLEGRAPDAAAPPASASTPQVAPAPASTPPVSHQVAPPAPSAPAAPATGPFSQGTPPVQGIDQR